VGDEQLLSDISVNLMKLDATMLDKRPKDCVNIISAVMADIKQGMASGAPEYRSAFEKLNSSCPELVRHTKEGFLHHEKKNEIGFNSSQQQLSSMILDMQMLIGMTSKKRAADVDMSFNLMEAADMVMKALTGLVTSK